jgi:hypothetical protein
MAFGPDPALYNSQQGAAMFAAAMMPQLMGAPAGPPGPFVAIPMPGPWLPVGAPLPAGGFPMPAAGAAPPQHGAGPGGAERGGDAGGGASGLYRAPSGGQAPSLRGTQVFHPFSQDTGKRLPTGACFSSQAQTSCLNKLSVPDFRMVILLVPSRMRFVSVGLPN